MFLFVWLPGRLAHFLSARSAHMQPFIRCCGVGIKYVHVCIKMDACIWIERITVMDLKARQPPAKQAPAGPQHLHTERGRTREFWGPGAEKEGAPAVCAGSCDIFYSEVEEEGHPT